ncbi:Helix-turn-helix domain-containing protein [Streptosporangium subroseum]|uniref:Helix-turn-helix domain-containing protein n=1 Tax=Streptosporangium subroseum TaxID=106412 RepID=A0A239KUK8_9ACTN|nr:helix-turn-helix domain-containing protein [Streptosporangium subroseum]SNT22057.1 Helix-turn-helix domain-containing protein [Streptosporangium subroseum]
MDHAELGQRLRSRRAALGRTVASVAADAALSVPYVANLENGRGNPTVSALDRLAEALGTRLTVTLADPDSGFGEPPPPPALLGFTRTRYFRREAGSLATSLGEEPHRIRTRLLDALAAVARGLGRDDLSERDWQRLLDAMILILAHPTEPSSIVEP